MKDRGYLYDAILQALQDPSGVLKRHPDESDNQHRARAVAVRLTHENLDDVRSWQEHPFDLERYIENLEDDATSEYPVVAHLFSQCYLLSPPKEFDE